MTHYATVAGALTMAVGGVTSASHAAVVTSSSSGPFWTGTVSAPGTQSNVLWGDTFMNSKFWAAAVQATAVRYLIFNVAGGRIHAGRLSAGEVIGDSGSSLFTEGRGQVEMKSNLSNSVWNAVAQPGLSEWSFGSSNAVRGFLAFRLGSVGAYNYGYFDIEFTRSGQAANSSFALTIHGWAYDSTLNQSITIAGSAAPVPGGSGLAALAFGAAGIRGRRRSRS